MFVLFVLNVRAVENISVHDSIRSYVKADQGDRAQALADRLLQRWLRRDDDSSLFKDGYFLGSVYRHFHHDKNAIDVYQRLAEVAKALKDTANMAECSYQLGRLYADQGVDNHALEALFLALRISEAVGDSSQRAKVLNQIGIVKKHQGFYKKSIEYFAEAMETNNRSGADGSSLQAAILNNLGSAYKKLGNYPEAKEFFLRAIALNKHLGQKRWLSYNYNNLANIYEETGDLESALIYHRMGLRLKLEVNDPPGLSTSYANLSLVFQKKGQPDSALFYIRKAEQLAMRYGVADIIPETLTQHAELLSMTGRDREAYEKIKQLNAYQDSIANADKSAIISQIEAKYQREKIESENRLLKKDLELQESRIRQKDTLIIGAIIGLAMLTALVFLFVSATRSRARTNKALAEQNASIHAQKEKIERQKSELQQAHEQLQQLQKDKEVFYSTITHDMRGPLNGILTVSSMMAEDASTEEDRKQIQALRFSALTLLSLVDDVLDLSRIESNRFQINEEVFDFRDMCSGVKAAYEFVATEKSLDFTCEDRIAHSRLRGDKRRITRLLFNLLGNAFKFTSSGSVTLGVTVTPLPDTNEAGVTVQVRDTGIGISEESLRVIFERFGQASELGSQGQIGSGLGLYICKTITEQMGGDIQVHSAPGKGTEFKVTFRLEMVPTSA